MLQRLLCRIKNGVTPSREGLLENPDPHVARSKETPCFKRLHDNEKQNFLKLLEQTGQELSAEELQIVDEFLSHEGHLSEDFIREKLEAKGIDVSREAIRQILLLLCRYGLAQRVLLNGKGPWYEHLHIGENHDHLMCTRCGKVVEFCSSSTIVRVCLVCVLGLLQLTPEK